MKWLILIGLALSLLPARAQQARVAGLESDSLYMALLGRELGMQQTEDSLAGLLSGTRLQLREASADERGYWGEQILRLEAELLQLRGKLGLLSGKINTIEQQFVMDNLFATPAPQAASGMDDYLRAQLSAENLAAWRQAAARELPTYNFVKTYLANYLNIRDLAARYDPAASQADSLHTRYTELRRYAGVMSDTIAALWDSIYDTKTYLCDLLMEKAGNRVYMERLQDRLVQLEGEKAALGDEPDAAAVSYYAPEKRFVLRSELAVADFLADHPRADSLRTAIAALEGMMPLPLIALAPPVRDTLPELDARGRPIKKRPAAEPAAHRIEIVSRASTLPDEVRELLGAGEIARAASSDAGGELFTFIVVVGQGGAHAEALAAEIRKAAPTLIVQIEPIR